MAYYCILEGCGLGVGREQFSGKFGRLLGVCRKNDTGISPPKFEGLYFPAIYLLMCFALLVKAFFLQDLDKRFAHDGRSVGYLDSAFVHNADLFISRSFSA